VDYALWMLVFVALIVSGSAQVFMAIELRRMRVRMAVDQGGTNPAATSHHWPKSEGPMGSPAGYAIYVYRADRWELEADLSAPGFEPSAPALKGAYEGQVIKKESAPAPGR
jgi:hypothetical protein